MMKDEIQCEDGRRCVRGVVSYGKGAEFRRGVGERAVRRRRNTGAMTLAVLISSALLWSRGCASPPHAVVELNTTNFDVLTETPMFVKVRHSRTHTRIYEDANALESPDTKIGAHAFDCGNVAWTDATDALCYSFSRRGVHIAA